MKKKFFILFLIITIFIGVNLSAVFAANKIGNNTVEESNVEVEKTENANTSNTEKSDNNSGLGMIAVALATGLACIGAGIAVATVGASAVGAISENPKLLGKTIIFAGLAEGIAIYGLIISIMILNKI